MRSDGQVQWSADEAAAGAKSYPDDRSAAANDARKAWLDAEEVCPLPAGTRPTGLAAIGQAARLAHDTGREPYRAAREVADRICLESGGQYLPYVVWATVKRPYLGTVRLSFGRSTDLAEAQRLAEDLASQDGYASVEVTQTRAYPTAYTWTPAAQA